MIGSMVKYLSTCEVQTNATTDMAATNTESRTHGIYTLYVELLAQAVNVAILAELDIASDVITTVFMFLVYHCWF